MKARKSNVAAFCAAVEAAFDRGAITVGNAAQRLSGTWLKPPPTYSGWKTHRPPRYPGKKLRAIRKQNGVGRPPAVNLQRIAEGRIVPLPAGTTNVYEAERSLRGGQETHHA